MNTLCKGLAALTVALGLLLGGCATNQPIRDAAYAPAMPMVQTPPQVADGAIYREGFDMRLFEDTKARQVGDVLTIVLTEKTDASKSAATKATKKQGFDMTGTLMGQSPRINGFDVFNNAISSGRDFAGDGSSEQRNSLSGSISVTVWQVLPNGNLVVRGEKVVTLNQGDEFIRIAGIVRPLDIKPDNTIESTKVANAQITYSGQGVLTESNQMGWLARFFHSALWPF